MLQLRNAQCNLVYILKFVQDSVQRPLRSPAQKSQICLDKNPGIWVQIEQQDEHSSSVLTES